MAPSPLQPRNRVWLFLNQPLVLVLLGGLCTLIGGVYRIAGLMQDLVEFQKSATIRVEQLERRVTNMEQQNAVVGQRLSYLERR